MSAPPALQLAAIWLSSACAEFLLGCFVFDGGTALLLPAFTRDPPSATTAKFTPLDKKWDVVPQPRELVFR